MEGIIGAIIVLLLVFSVLYWFVAKETQQKKGRHLALERYNRAIAYHERLLSTCQTALPASLKILIYKRMIDLLSNVQSHALKEVSAVIQMKEDELLALQSEMHIPFEYCIPDSGPLRENALRDLFNIRRFLIKESKISSFWITEVQQELTALDVATMRTTVFSGIKKGERLLEKGSLGSARECFERVIALLHKKPNCLTSFKKELDQAKMHLEEIRLQMSSPNGVDVDLPHSYVQSLSASNIKEVPLPSAEENHGLDSFMDEKKKYWA